MSREAFEQTAECRSTGPALASAEPGIASAGRRRTARHSAHRPETQPRHTGQSRTRKATALAAAVVAAIALAACGSADVKETSGSYAGEGGVGAPYLAVGSLTYQVQISRALNPYDTEDSAYLEGLSSAQRELRAGEEWFAVFVQVYNETEMPHNDASELTIYDTEGNVYHPVEPNGYNLYAYRPGAKVEKGHQLPTLSSTAASGPINGLMLLYKIKDESMENRPLKIKIVSPTNSSEVATAELDS